jgi:hypothetical protein
MGTPVRYPFGVTTVTKQSPLGDFPLPSPFQSASNPSMGVAVYENDFTRSSAEYTVTGASSTFALTSVIGGAALMTPGGTTTATAAYAPRSLKFVSGQKAWFLARFQVSAVAGNVVVLAGLRIGSGVTDGLWFSKPAASTSVKLISTVNSTAADLATGLATMAAATDISLGLYYDGTDLLVYVNGALVDRIESPTIGSTGTTLTNAVMGPFVAVTPTATDTMTLDYVLSACEVERT